MFSLPRPLRGPEAAALAAVLALGLTTGLWGIRWGLPDGERLRAFPGGRPTPEAAQRFADSWNRMYRDMAQARHDMRKDEASNYLQGTLEVAPGWTSPPEALQNSYRSMLLQSANPDEKKSFIILAQMHPSRLDFKPIYVQYGGAFIYPLGIFLKLASWTGAVVLAGLPHYLERPEDMGRAYLCGRLFILAFQLGSLCILFDLGRRLSGWRTGLSAAALFALSPSIIENSHILKPHPYAAFWTLAGVRWLLFAHSGGERRNYLLCGLAAGMAVGSNLSLAFLLGMPALAWLVRRQAGRAAPGEIRDALLGLAAAGAVFAATNPYLIFRYRDFAWELEIYSPPKIRLTAEGLSLFLGSLARGMGAAALALCLAGSAAALGRGRTRLLIDLVLWGASLLVWSKFWSLSQTPIGLRVYYPMIGLACLLGADLLWSPYFPRLLRAVFLAAALVDSGLRSFVYLENMRLDSGPGANRLRAASWIEGNIPAGGEIGLIRYPDPAHTPPFRYDRYRLVFFDRPEALKAGRIPAYLVADRSELPSIDAWVKNNYNAAAAFLPLEAGWARIADDSPFINGAMHIYRAKTGRGP